jgi:hypothetical protein
MDTPKPRLPRLSAAARRRVKETIEGERAMGDRQLASDLEMLLLAHDRAHGIVAPAGAPGDDVSP